MIDELKNVDNGRVKELLDTFDIKDACFNCGYFNKSKESKYRCAVMPSCIGVTLSEETKEYLLNAIQKTEKS